MTAVAAVAAAALATTATATASDRQPLPRWTATRASAMQQPTSTAGPSWSASGFDDQTIRETV